MADQPNRMQDRLADMMEATRLTAAGRLQDATTLLQRGLTGASAPRASDAAPRTIDLTAERIEDKHTSPREATGRTGLLPEGLRKVVETVTRGVAPVLEGLKGGGLAEGFGRPSQRPSPAGEGGEFVARAFSNAQGARDYKLFVPEGIGANRPLVVMLHGCTQSPDDFAAGTGMNELAVAQGFYVAYPGQSGRANGQRCWNWFQPGDQGRDSGEAGIIAGLTRAIIAEHRIDPRRVYIAGLSAGGAAAANIARAYPDLYAGVGIHSGLAAGCARDVSTALSVMRLGPVASADCDTGTIRMPTIVFHGESDSTVHPSNGEQALAQAGIAGLKPQVAEAVSPGGLAYQRTRYADAHGRVTAESWMVRGLSHAWSGGSASGSYTDPRGPDASRAMIDFFMEHPLA